MQLDVPRLMRNPVSLTGAGLVTLAAILFLFVYGLELFVAHTNPYIGLVFFIVMPGLFVLGLLLIPLGIWRERRRIRAGRTRPPGWPVLDFNSPRVRRLTLAVSALTIVNVLIVSLAAFRGVEYMDSVSFCGQVCHEVMQPEFTSYQAGPHARVRCVDCHIGPGAPWFVRSKLSGARQLYAVAFNTHSRPIPSPVENLRPARDTCEQCHWPAKFHGDIVRAVREYADDAAGSETVTVLRLHVGGGSDAVVPVRGIHWHTSNLNAIDYVATDAGRQTISVVRLTRPDGSVKEWKAPDADARVAAYAERRRMDCMDCHNRPSHQFAPSPERAIDKAIADGEIERRLPFIRREAVRAVKASYPDRDAAFQGIERQLTAFYRNGDAPPSPADVTRAVQAVQRVYSRNVFPAMKVGWGTYVNNLGHVDSPGCFRCHDDNHKASDGTTISQDCDLCHTIE